MSLKDVFFKDEDEELSAEVSTSPEIPELAVEHSETINSVYQKSELSDMSKSIFKVQQIRSSFPNTVPLEVVKQALPGLLSAANLTLDEVRHDAEMRIAALNEALQQFSGMISGEIQTLTDDITKLSAQIEEKRQAITKAQSEKDAFTEAVNTELKVVEDNIQFIA